MSRPAEPNRSPVSSTTPRSRLGLPRCEHCGRPSPLARLAVPASTCPGYAQTWARDTMRKNRENLRTYGGLAAMCTLTPPGVDAGLVWDRVAMPP